MVFDHRKPNHYSDLKFLFKFLCSLLYTQFVEELYIGVVEGSIIPLKANALYESGRLGLIQ